MYMYQAMLTLTKEIQSIACADLMVNHKSGTIIADVPAVSGGLMHAH